MGVGVSKNNNVNLDKEILDKLKKKWIVISILNDTYATVNINGEFTKHHIDNKLTFKDMQNKTRIIKINSKGDIIYELDNPKVYFELDKKSVTDNVCIWSNNAVTLKHVKFYWILEEKFNEIKTQFFNEYKISSKKIIDKIAELEKEVTTKKSDETTANETTANETTEKPTTEKPTTEKPPTEKLPTEKPPASGGRSSKSESKKYKPNVKKTRRKKH